MYDKNKDIVFNLEYTIVKFVKFMILQILFYIMRGFGVRLMVTSLWSDSPLVRQPIGPTAH